MKFGVEDVTREALSKKGPLSHVLKCPVRGHYVEDDDFGDPFQLSPEHVVEMVNVSQGKGVGNALLAVAWFLQSPDLSATASQSKAAAEQYSQLVCLPQ